MPSTIFSYTGAQQTWVVPANVFSVLLEAWGAEGGGRVNGGYSRNGGKGGYARGTLAVTPGETLYIRVGGKPPDTATVFAGGWNGGGDGGQRSPDWHGGGGGGSSDVRVGGTAHTDRKIVAGGGGGAGATTDPSNLFGRGGDGGASTGQDGDNSSSSWRAGVGRGGGQTSSGAGGAATSVGDGATNGTSGAYDQGGTGGNGGTGGSIGGSAGGGGGSGWRSGGGGGGGRYNADDGGMAGGGSNYVTGLTSTSSSRGIRSGHGQIQLTWSETPPNAPSNITPSSGATVSTDLPTLGGTVTTHPAGSGIRQKIEWNLSTQPDFSSPWRLIQGPLGTSTSKSTVLQEPHELFQGVWYIRGRTIDEYGGVSGWSASHTFTVAHAPSTTGHSPTGNPTAVFGDGNHIFSWTFTDPSSIDFQSGYEVEVERTDGTAVVSSGIVVSGTESATLAIPVGEKDQSLRWRVRVRDRDDVWSSFSSWHLFKVADPGTVTVTAPTASIATATPLVEWTNLFGGGRNQTHKQVRFKDDLGAVIHDTGWLTSSTNSHQVQDPILDNGMDYTVEVRVRDNEGLESNWDSEPFSVAFTAPESPLFTLTDLYSTDGYVSIAWDDSRHDDDFFYYRVWRRELVDGEYTDWEMLIERNDQPGQYEYREWLAGVDRTYQYAVTQAANRFGDIVESDRFPQSVTPVSEHYWLVHPLDESLTIRVERVTGEDFDEQYEQESMHVLGRGRHVDYGDRLGFTGSLTAQFRDYENGLSARAQRQKLLGIKASRNVVYLRNPFGDVWQVAVGDLAIGRVGGVGRREFFDVTIPYEEVL